MIETKEQYEMFLNTLGNRQRPAFEETIEALREVARAGREIERNFLSSVEDSSLTVVPIYDIAELKKTLDALPDWICEE